MNIILKKKINFVHFYYLKMDLIYDKQIFLIVLQFMIKT